MAEDVLPKVLHRWGPVPGVAGTRDLTGPWNIPGSERTVLLEDGSTARERVLQWERPVRFSYRVDRLTNPLGRFVQCAVGEWEFSAARQGSAFCWTYTFYATGALSGLVLRPVVALFWAGYMRACADRCVDLARR